MMLGTFLQIIMYVQKMSSKKQYQMCANNGAIFVFVKFTQTTEKISFDFIHVPFFEINL